MQKFYHYFKNKEGRDPKLTLETNSQTLKSINVCWMRKSREYTSFNTPKNLYTYIRNQPKSQRTFFEMIRGDQQQKVYFDVDISGVANLQEVSNTLMISLISAIIESAKDYKINLTPQDVMIFKSSNEKKKSFHVILYKYCVASNRHNRAFFENVIERIPKHLQEFIDPKMYSSLQQFRLSGNQKPNSGRYKKLIPVYTFEGNKIKFPIPNINKKLLDYYIFETSMITLTNTCKIIPIKIEDVKQYENLPQATNEDVKDAMSRVSSVVFSLKDVIGNMICLSRLKPAMCNICKRVHDSETAFMILEHNIKFYCRRSAKGKFKNLGVLNSKIAVKEDIKTTKNLHVIEELERLAEEQK